MVQNLFKFKQKKNLDLGFTTLEVLISIIIALAFVSITMQSFVLAVAIKVQAQEKQRANQLIQEDLELLSDIATRIPEDHTNKCDPASYADGYAKELIDLIEADKPNGHSSLSVQLLQDKNGTGSGKTLTLTRTDVTAGNPTATPAVPVSSTAPHRTLKINYQVTDPDNTVVAQRYVEVIPDVALRCP